VTAGATTSGTVSYAQTLKGWFVMTSWKSVVGDGWGRSWFDADNPQKTTSTNYKVECQACDVPARVPDWIYIQGYPAPKQ
jgi:hypothetical protein